jgi:hypothetical protein
MGEVEMTREELLALADRVDALSGPDREVDTWIENHLGLAQFEQPHPFRSYCDGETRIEPKHFTASLDAAMTLVPEGHSWTLGQNVHHKHWVCSINYLNDEGAPACLADSLSRATAALALTAAALRAQAEALK